MRRLARWLAVAALVAFEAHAATVDTGLRMVSGSQRSTAIDAARDLAVLIAPAAGVSLEVLPSAGSVENVRTLRNDASVQLGLVQADVLQAYLGLAAGGDAAAARLIAPLRVVMPLFTEEVHFIVRADSPMRFVGDIRNARINLGERGSGSALTAASIYRLLFDAPLAEARGTHYTDEEALVRLVTDRSVDVVVLVGGQPLRLLEDARPEARQHIKLLAFDDGDPAAERVLSRYALTTLRAASYPNLLVRDSDALAVRTMLMTVDETGPVIRDAIARFAGALCRNVDRLRRHGHFKWRELDVRLPDLGRGWIYHAAASRAISSCIADRVSAGVERPR